MKGRKPVPTETKKLNGNPSKRRMPDDEPQFPVEAPEPPGWFDTEARAEWDRIVPELTAARTVAKSFRVALVAYCEAWSRYVNAVAQVKATGGEVIKSPNDFPIQNPYSAIRNAALKQMTTLAAEFGLTPSAKTRVKAAKAPSAQSALKLFASKRA